MLNKFPLVCSTSKETIYSYKEYIESIHWKLLKERYLISGLSKRCYKCNSKEVPYEFYHRTYKRMGKEKLTDIVPMCLKCYEVILDTKHNLTEKSWNVPRKKGKKKALRFQLKRYAFNPCNLSESEYNWMVNLQPRLRGCLLSKYFSNKVKAYQVSPSWINKQVSNASKWIQKETYGK